jgi:glutathione S-transferase
VPWIVDDGEVVADSAFIVQHLRARHGDTLDAWLTDEQRASAHALRRMVEEGLCFSILHTRWADDVIYRQAIPLALAGVPRPLRSAIAPLVRRRILRDLWGQGAGRYTADEAAGVGCLDLDVMAARLRTHPFAMGERPCSLDAVFYAFLAVILAVPLDTPLKRHAEGHACLTSYLERVQRMLDGKP